MVARLVVGQGRLPRGTRHLVMCVALVGAMSILAPRAQAAAGTITDLGSLQFGCGSAAIAINNSGQVAGTSCSEPFRWTAAGGMQGLGSLSSAYPDGAAAAMNAKGEVTGWSDDEPAGYPNAFVWSPAKGMKDLTPGDFYPGTLGQAINASGQVAYTELDADSTRGGYVWSPSKGAPSVGALNGTVVNIGIGPPPYTMFPCCVSAAALNDHGDTTGLAETWIGQSIYTHAYLSTPSGGMQDLGTLPGDVNSAGVAVNDHQDVAGNSENADDVLHGFVWTPTAGMEELTLPDATSSDAVDINNKGEVVGYAQLSGGTTEAFLWSAAHGMKELGAGEATAINQNGAVAIAGTDGNAYRWTASGGLTEIGPGTPTAINDRGQVAGDGTNGDAFLWSPATKNRR